MIKKIMVQRKIPFKEARNLAEQEIEGSVPQVGKSFANAAAAANGRQNNNPPPTKKTISARSAVLSPTSGTDIFERPK